MNKYKHKYVSRVLLALIAGSFAGITLAQTTAPAEKPTVTDKQSTVRSVTENKSGSSASAQDAAKQQRKNVEKAQGPRVLPDAMDKQNAVGTVTENKAGSNVSAQDVEKQRAANTAASRGTPSALKTDSPEPAERGLKPKK